MFECSFCGKRENEVGYLITNPKVNICNECVLLCVEVIIEDSIKARKENHELKKALHLIETM